MSYAFDVDNSSNYTKPSREYGVLGVNYNQNLVPLIANNPWPAMDTQYLAYPNAPRTYYSLTKDNNGQPYATINSGYPGACSYYNIVSCPTNNVTRQFPADPNVNNGCGNNGVMVQPTVVPVGPLGTPTPGAMDACPAINGTSASADSYSLIRFMNANHFVLYADDSTAASVINVFPATTQAFIEVKNPSDASVSAEMKQRGITGQPVLVSSATGLSYKGVPSSFASVQQFFGFSTSTYGTDTPSGTAIPRGTGRPVVMGTSAPTTMATYIAVIRPSCPFCTSLIRDVESSPIKNQFFFIDESDTQGIQTYLGPNPPIVGYPFIYNTVNRKSVTGYNSTKGLQNLVQYLQ